MSKKPQHHKFRNLVRTIITVVLLIGLLLGAVEWVLRRHLVRVITTHVAPSVAARTGCDLTVAHARASLLGNMTLRELTLDGPMPTATPDTLLTAESIRIDADLKQLRQRVVEIPSITASGINLTLTRQPDGTHNVGKLLSQAKRSSSSESASSPTPATGAPTPTPTTPPDDSAPKPPSSAKSVGVRVASFQSDMKIHYHDYYRRDQPLRLTLDLTATGQELSTVQSDTIPGTVVLKGHLAQNPALFTTDLIVQLHPLHNPAQPSFVADGTVVNIDMGELGPWQEKLGFTSPSVTLKIELTCKEGAFDPSRSKLVLRMLNPTLTGKLASKYPPMTK